jgi:diguanylate cyclase (GGDEF)-like protein
MNQDMLERILKCPNLPTLPAVAVRVIELTQNVNVSVDELTSTIQNDQALAAKILRTVNSSFYGVRRPCASISQAIVMLGLETVKTLALSFSLLSCMEGADDEFDHVAYWRRGLFTATAAKLIAREAGVAQEEEAFLGGLLQDVGMMAMYMALGRSYLRIILQADSDHRKLVKYELAALELQHPDVGAMLVQRWRLPDNLVMPVKYHERPTAAPPEYSDLVRCVGLGNVAHDVLTDAEPGPALRRFHERARQWFEIDTASADRLIGDISASVVELSAVFRLRTGEAPEASDILSRARQQMAVLTSHPGEERTQGASLGSLVNDADEYDPLTGVLTHTAWMNRAESAFAENSEPGRCLSVLEVSLDRFAQTVQSRGTDAGDTVLVETGGLLQDHFEILGGAVAREGNAAFLVLLPGTSREEASKLAMDARAMIEEQSQAWDTGGWQVTVSIGAATLDEETRRHLPRLESLLVAAHKASEAAAKAGGNCVRALSSRKAAA